MMLFYKAWRESRARFLMIAFLLTAMCSYAVFFQHHGVALTSADYKEEVWKTIYSGTAKGLFAILLLFLGLGGLLRERARGTAMFTLILPVSRLQIIGAAVAVGLLEMAALTLLPALLLPALSPIVHQSYPLAEALQYSVLWFGCGTVIFSLAFLLSVVFSGEYTAAAAAFITLFSYAFVTTQGPLRPYRLNVLYTMSGMDWLHMGFAPQYLFIGHLPWTRLLVINVIALGLFAVASRITERQDF